MEHDNEFFTNADQADSVLWELFHENTKLTPSLESLPSGEAEKHLSGLLEACPFDGYPTVGLPRRLAPFKMSIRQAFRARSSLRHMRMHRLKLADLSTILHSGYGITRHPANSPRSLRAVPSAGGLFPLELFIYVNSARGVAPGLYHYHPPKHHLRILREEIDVDDISRCFIQKDIAAKASALIFLTALFTRSTTKYGNRGYRFVLLEAGHIAQNIALACSALGLGSLSVGGFFDREIDSFLQLDGLTHSTIYVIAVGAHDSELYSK
jgi:SagB-type dehydrogenase family enzyme